MGVWYFGEMLSQSKLTAKLTFISGLLAMSETHKTDVTWVFGILEKILSQSEMTAKLTFNSVCLAMRENTRLIPCSEP